MDLRDFSKTELEQVRDSGNSTPDLRRQAAIELNRRTQVSHEFGNGVRCYNPAPIVWTNSEDCLHEDEL